MELDEAQGARALELIRQLRDPTLPDDATDAPLTELERLLAYPAVSDLMFYEDPELTDEQVIERALQHPPLTL